MQVCRLALMYLAIQWGAGEPSPTDANHNVTSEEHVPSEEHVTPENRHETTGPSTTDAYALDTNTAADLSDLPTPNSSLIAGENASTLQRFLQILHARGEDLGLPPPSGQGHPLEVKIHLDISHLLGLSEKNMDFVMDVVLRQIWTDRRLSFADVIENVESIGIPDHYYQGVWLPDTCLVDGKEEMLHDVTMANKMFRIYRNDTVVYSQRLKLVVWCPLALQRFPLDNQTCDVKLTTFRYDSTEVSLEWLDEHTGVSTDRLNTEEMAMFKISRVSTGNCTYQPLTGMFSCIRFRVEFDRQFGFYVIQVYVPNILIVMLSWVSFWLEPRAVPARISLGILTLLAMTNQMSAMTSDAMPRVSYVKSIDVWLTGSMAFLVGAMLEYAVVNTLVQHHDFVKHNRAAYALRGDQLKRRRSKSRIAPDDPGEETTDAKANGVSMDPVVDPDMISMYDNSPCCTKQMPNAVELAYNIDKISRYFFPLCFALFNTLYWVLYLYVI